MDSDKHEHDANCKVHPEDCGEPKPTILELARELAMKIEIKLEEFLNGG